MSYTSSTIPASERFHHLIPAIERAVKRALYSCQQADQEDALQVGLIEVWRKLQEPETAGNTDSWFIFRAVGYARDYASRLVYRYQRRHEPIVSRDEEPEGAATLPVEPAAPDATATIEDALVLEAMLARLDSPVQREIALRLVRGEKKTEIAAGMGLRYKAVIYQCEKIATALASAEHSFLLILCAAVLSVFIRRRGARLACAAALSAPARGHCGGHSATWSACLQNRRAKAHTL